MGLEFEVVKSEGGGEEEWLLRESWFPAILGKPRSTVTTVSIKSPISLILG